MALTRTTLSAAVTVNDLVFPVTSATGFAAGQFVLVDNEFSIIDRSYSSGTNIPVYRRGDQGTRVVAHNALAEVVTGNMSDLADLATFAMVRRPPYQDDVVWMSVTGAITVPVKDTTVILNKAGVAAMTLAAPAKDQTGITLTITSDTAQAHTVTATSLLSTGTASVSVATFAASKGSGLVLKAVDGLWNVISSTGITFS